VGATVKVQMEIDPYEKPLSADFMECMEDETKALKTFKPYRNHIKIFFKLDRICQNGYHQGKTNRTGHHRAGYGIWFFEMMRMNKKKE